MKYFLIAVTFLFSCMCSFAQTSPPRQRPLTGNVVEDIKNAVKPADTGSQVNQALGGKNNDIANILAKPFNDLADFINSDAEAAAKLAISVPDLQDGNGQQCWLAMSQFTAVLKAHPIPITLHQMTDLEALRLAAMAANNVCKNSACTQVFADLSNSIQKVAPVSVGIAIPSLNSLCSQVPVVSVVPPVPMPPNVPATPTTTPTQQ